jgi:hypothetical protein
MNNLDLLYEIKNRLGMLDLGLALCIPLLVLNMAFTAILLNRKESR